MTADARIMVATEVSGSETATMASPLSIILARGYFPKELPPPFNTKSFGAFADTAPAAFHLDITKKGIKNNLTTRAAVHNLARTGTLRRKLTIPSPVNQFYPSIYTHSIPWALHTKSVAKAKPNDYSLLGSELYKYHLSMPLDRSRITESLQQLIEPKNRSCQIPSALFRAGGAFLAGRSRR